MAQRADSWSIKLTLLLASTLTVMAGATLAPALPAMGTYFAEVDNAAFWVRLLLTAPALSIALGAPVAGQLADTLGRKSLLMGSVLLYGLAGSSGFVLDSLFHILAGRAILGLAVAGCMVSATTLIADYYQGERRSRFMGIQAAFMSLGGVVFLSVSGAIADINWRLPFLIYLFAWVLFPAIVLTLYEPSRPQAKADPRPGEEAVPTKMPFPLLVFIYGSSLFSQVVFYMIPVQLPFYLEQLASASASQSGIAIALLTLCSAIASMNYGKLKQKLSYVNILVIAFLLMGAGYICISLVGTYHFILLALIPAGLGLGVLIPNLSVWTTTTVPADLRGRTLGGLTTCLFLGQFLSPIVMQPLIQVIDLAATYGVAGVCLLVSGAIFWIGQKQIDRFVEHP